MLPFFVNDEEILQDEQVVVAEPSKTYYFDFDKGELMAQFIDNEDAIVQAAVKAIKTARDRYLIYSSDYGSELSDLTGHVYSLEYLIIEIPRLIKEALIVDTRIADCTNFNIDQVDSNVFVSFELINNIDNSTIVEVII